MCDPVTIALIATAVTATTTVASLGAEQLQAEAQAEQNAILSSINAAKERAAGKKLSARQRVLFAKGGVQLSGTPEDVLSETAEQAESNALATMYSGKITQSQLLASADARGMEQIGAIAKGVVDTQTIKKTF